MAIKETIVEALALTDSLLRQNGLYATFTYTQVSHGEEDYNEVTGEYVKAKTTSVVHTFEAVPLEQRGASLKEGVYSVMMDIIAIPFNVPFEMAVDIPLEYNGYTWTIASYKTAPQEGVYEIVLGRK